jgi:predicted aconitase with swiveling domain
MEGAQIMKIKAKSIVKGVVRGEAIISRMPISFTGGVDPNTGNVREPGHDLEGKSIAGKILIFPMGKGSTTGSWQFYATYKRGNAPKGIINLQSEGVVAVSAVITGTPMVHQPEKDPFEYIKDGDMVTINGDEGFIEIE